MSSLKRISLRKLGTSLRTLQRKRKKDRRQSTDPPATLRSSTVKRDCPDETETVLPPTFPPLKCVVGRESNGVEFEKDFIKLLVNNGVDRILSNFPFRYLQS